MGITQSRHHRKRKILRLGASEAHLKMKDLPVLTWPRKMFSEVCRREVKHHIDDPHTLVLGGIFFQTCGCSPAQPVN